MRGVLCVSVLLSLMLLSACAKKAPTEEASTVDTAPTKLAVAEPEIDPATGFRISGDWELVRAHCTGCHSPRLITQQRGSAEHWLKLIRWMQEKQNLWQFDADTESRIIAYLADNYPPDAARRRAAIPREMMPPNPYSLETASLN